MVDEVEIKNVGGKNGVASEATLAALVSALNSGGVSREKIAKLESLARSANTKKINEEFKQRGILGRTFSSLASSAGGLAKEFVAGGNRMSDFSQAVFGAESSITGLVRAVDGLIDSYRELTSVGASFNNSMYDFIKASAESGMTLSDYSNFILKNSERMTMLGGSVTEGSKRFGEISKALRQNFGPNLTRVGMTLGDMNDILIEYTDFSISRMGRETRSNMQLARGAANYALELDKLSKLTGVSRKQLAESIRDQQADQRARVATANMTTEQAERFNRALAVAGEASPALKEAFIDLSDGLPDNKVTERLMAIIPNFEKLAGDIENMSTEDLAKFLRTTGQQIDEFSNMPGFQRLIESDAGFAGLADIGAGLRRYSDLTDEQFDKLVSEQEAMDTLTQTLLNFETALSNLRTFIIDEIIKSEAFKQLESFGKELLALFNQLFNPSGAANSAKEGFKSLTDSLIGTDGLITSGIIVLRNELKKFSDYLKTGGDPVEYLKEKLSTVASAVYDWFKELIFGEEIMVGREDDRRLERRGGLLESIVSGFESFWESDSMTALKDTIAGYFEQLIQKMEDTFVNSWLARTILGIDQEEVAARHATDDKAATETSAENIGNVVGDHLKTYSDMTGTEQQALLRAIPELIDSLPETQRQAFEEAMAANRESFGGSLRSMLGTTQQATLNNIIGKAQSGEASQAEMDLLESFYANALSRGLVGPEDEYATGTVGFEDFGNERTAKLHGVEAVVPRNTQAGEALSKYFTDDWRAKSQPVQASSNAGNQEALTKLLGQLNNTMALVLSEMKINNDLNKKTISSVKGLSGDLYRGV